MTDPNSFEGLRGAVRTSGDVKALLLVSTGSLADLLAEYDRLREQTGDDSGDLEQPNDRHRSSHKRAGELHPGGRKE